MDCAICVAFLEGKEPVCRMFGPDRRCHKNCTIFGCDKVLGKFYHNCAEFLCKSLRQLELRYSKNYGISMLEILEAIRQHGIRKFIKSQKRAPDLFNVRRGNFVDRGFCWTCGEKKEYLSVFMIS